MVMKMNNNILDKLKEKTSYSKEQCNILKNILEKHKIVGRKNKDKIIQDFMQELQIDRNEADELYNNCMEIRLKEIFE